MQVQAGQLWRSHVGNVFEVLAVEGAYARVLQRSRGVFQGSVFRFHVSSLPAGGKLAGWVTARFWVYHGPRECWVKLALGYGESRSWYRRGPAEEGWSGSGETYEHIGDGVRLEWFEEGRDCDGRYESGGECFCPLHALAAHEGHDGTMCPAWESVDSHQRDYTAEAAGY